MKDKVKIFGFAGSLRDGAYSKAVARFVTKLIQEKGTEAEFVDLKDLDIPLYDADVQEAGFPADAKNLKDKIRAADAVLIVSPEYNHASPGVLKNAINWMSRPYGDSAFEDKLVGMMSTSPGRVGGARALLDLRVSLAEMGAWVMPNEVSIGQVHELLNEKGEITDLQLVEIIQDFLDELILWTKRFKGMKKNGGK